MTPLSYLVQAAMFGWLLFSGWLARIFFLTAFSLPLLPLFLHNILKASLVQVGSVDDR